VWHHTMILAFPAICFALDQAWQRMAVARGTEAAQARKRRTLEFLAIVLLALVLLSAESYGGAGLLAAAGVFLAVPIAALCVLAWISLGPRDDSAQR